jgi:uncharacterized membrane protein YidH (DUF202 family)
MGLRRIVGVVLVVVGAVLAWQGWEARQSFGTRLGDLVGSSSSNTWLMLGGGAVLVVVGAMLALRG